jgi:phosphoribosylglycinamide formyltransferase-1
MDIVVMASGNGSTFQAILDDCEHVTVKALVTDNPNSYAIERAKKANIPYAICENKKMAQCVSYYSPQLVVLAGYMRILDSGFIRHHPNTVNIHPSLLPKFRGLGTYDRAIASGVNEHGTTVHWVVEELDAGPIIAQESFPVWQMDTVEILIDKTKEIEQELYPRIIDQIATGEIPLAS